MKTYHSIHSVNEDSDGYSLLLIGNSFFRPYAEKLDVSS